MFVALMFSIANTVAAIRKNVASSGHKHLVLKSINTEVAVSTFWHKNNYVSCPGREKGELHSTGSTSKCGSGIAGTSNYTKRSTPTYIKQSTVCTCVQHSYRKWKSVRRGYEATKTRFQLRSLVQRLFGGNEWNWLAGDTSAEIAPHCTKVMHGF